LAPFIDFKSFIEMIYISFGLSNIYKTIDYILLTIEIMVI